MHPKGDEYRCFPIPTKISPPVGPNLMMDLFMHPEDIAQDARFVLRQMPKKTHGELRASAQHAAMKDAWGIMFQEDWHWSKIGWILALGFFLPSLLFLTLWATLMKDERHARWGWDSELVGNRSDYCCWTNWGIFVGNSRK